jgi:hypothetical protein
MENDVGVNVNVRGRNVFESSLVGIPSPPLLQPGFVQLPGVMVDGCLVSIKTLLERSGRFLKMCEAGDPDDLEARAAFVKAAKNLNMTLANVQDFYEECKRSATDLDHDHRSILVIGWFSLSYFPVKKAIEDGTVAVKTLVCTRGEVARSVADKEPGPCAEDVVCKLKKGIENLLD